MPGLPVGNLFVIATLAAVTGCASSAPKSAGALEQDRPAQGSYRRVTRNGEVYFCRSQRVTASLTRVVESCLTEAQLDARRRDAQDYVNKTQTVPAQPAGSNPMNVGGRVLE